MTPTEILNTLEEKRIKLLNEILEGERRKQFSSVGEDYKFIPFVDPDVEEQTVILPNPLRIVSKEDYLIYCIHAFIVNALASNEPNFLEGYEKAKKRVNKVKSYGRTYDLNIDVGTFRKSSILKVRVVGAGEQIGGNEQRDMSMWVGRSGLGTYLIVRTFTEFYNHFVKEFGEISI